MKKIIVFLTVLLLLFIIAFISITNIKNNSKLDLKNKFESLLNKSSNQSMESYENTITGNEENELKQALATTPTNKFITPEVNLDYYYTVDVYYHKSNEGIGTYHTFYGDDDCYKTLLLDITTNFDDQVYNSAIPTEKWMLRYRVNLNYYEIDISATEQREILQKLIDNNIYQLDNIVPTLWFSDQYRFRSKIIPGIPDFNLEAVNYIAIGVSDLVVWDGTNKNKAAIASYIAWLESKYIAELLKHPVAKWTDYQW